MANTKINQSQCEAKPRMKLHCLSKPAAFGFQKNLYNNSLFFTSLFSAKTLDKPRSSFSSSSSSYPDSLFQRVQAIRDPKASVLPVLRQWVNEGRPIGKDELGWLVRTMKDFRRFNHALEVWIHLPYCFVELFSMMMFLHFKPFLLNIAFFNQLGNWDIAFIARKFYFVCSV